MRQKTAGVFCRRAEKGSVRVMDNNVIKRVTRRRLWPFKPKQTTSRWSGLQSRITISYALTTIVVVLLIEILFVTMLILALLYTPLADGDLTRGAKLTVELYALKAAVQGNGAVLNPQTTFAPGQPASIALTEPDANNHPPVTYVSQKLPASQVVPFALLITPEGRVLASSYPARYPATTPVSHLLPARSHLIQQALAGNGGQIIETTQQGRSISIVEPVRSRDKHVIGIIYLQEPGLSDQALVPGFIGFYLVTGFLWVLVTLPVSIFFGIRTTRSLVRRLHSLVTATARFADGDYTQRVQVSREDEMGQLEARFNYMAEQLVESIGQRQKLAEHSARQEERNRIARDLHDSVKQQVFAVTMQIGAALSLLDVSKEAARKPLMEAEELSHQAQQELATLIRELRPVALQDNRGLAAALQEYVTSWSSQQAIATDVHLPASCPLPEPIEEAFLRIVQEALSNSARHSQATSVQITLECGPEQVQLAIVDNGCGFDAQKLNGTGVGLHSMRERMEALGGTIGLESAPGEGTRLTARCNIAVGVQSEVGAQFTSQSEDAVSGSVKEGRIWG
jgi:NarL family two-component system sensor histidine kinase LiaS